MPLSISCQFNCSKTSGVNLLGSKQSTRKEIFFGTEHFLHSCVEKDCTSVPWGELFNGLVG